MGGGLGATSLGINKIMRLKMLESEQAPLQKKKFTQKPIGVIFWLWLFFPVGIYFMWKERHLNNSK